MNLPLRGAFKEEVMEVFGVKHKPLYFKLPEK
jgi:hypothetical protein